MVPANKLTPKIERILVPTDFSPASERALAYALFLARSTGARVEVLHVWNAPVVSGGRLVFIAGEISQPLTEWSRKRAVSDMTTFLAACSAADSVETCIRDGEPAETIRNRAEEIEADLIAMGTRGNSGVTRILLGSVAERVLRTAPCPVLTVKPE